MLVPQIPLQAVNQVAALLPEENRALAFFLPEKEGMEYPTEQQVLDALAAVDAEQIDAYTEEVNNDPLVPELNSNVTIKKMQDGVYGTKLITLSNGIKVHVLHTDYSPNSIAMRAISWGGSSLYPNSEYNLVDNAHMVQVGGWGQFSAIDLQKKQFCEANIPLRQQEARLTNEYQKIMATAEIPLLHFAPPRR